MPTLSISPAVTDMYVVVRVGAQYLAPKDIPGLKIYPSHTASPSVFLTAADFTDFKLNTMGTYNLMANWPVVKASSDSWTGSLTVSFEESETENHIVTLIVDDPNYARTFIRHFWNEFTYVGSGTITPAATSKFNSAFFTGTTDYPFSYKYTNTVFEAEEQVEYQATAKLQVTLLTDATGTSVVAGTTAMTKLDNMNFIIDLGTDAVNQDITLTIKNGSETRTITVYIVVRR